MVDWHLIAKSSGFSFGLYSKKQDFTPRSNNMSRRSLLLLPFLVLQAALDLKSAESIHVSNSTLNNSTCPEGKLLFGNDCCDVCQPGTVVDHGCTKTNPISCKNCIEGAEYMDHPNVNSKCLRCSLCDTEHGWEVKENCTAKQNVKCGCRPGFFCSSEHCLHCEPCAKCEEDGIEEECTLTKNTKCRSKKVSQWYYLFLLIIPILTGAFLIGWCYKKRCSRKKEFSLPEYQNDEHIELDKYFPDIDLNPYIPDIANEMSKDNVLFLVRKLGLPQGTIEVVIDDHKGNTAEQKIKLLQTWYERNGIKNAHKKLITTLRQLKMCRTADKFEQILKP